MHIFISDGFHKKVSVELGGLKCDRDEMEFAHQFFCKGHPYLVEHIKRKVSTLMLMYTIIVNYKIFCYCHFL